MNKRWFSALLLTALLVSGASAGDPFTLSDTTSVPDPERPSARCFRAAPGRHIGGDLIPVDPESDYLLSGEFRGGRSGRFVLGLECFDARRQPIAMHHINPLDGTFTKLISPAVKGQTFIMIEDGKNWERPRGKVAVFHAKADLSDLPNRNTHYYVTSVVREGGGWKVSFSKPIMRNYPAGTAVRLHREGGVLQAIAFVKPSVQWEVSDALVERISSCGSLSERLWPGTKFVRLQLYLYPGEPVLFRNLKLVRTVPEKTAGLGEYEFRGSRLVSTFHPEHVLSASRSHRDWRLEINSFGMLRAQNLDLPAEKIAQLEVDFAASGAPGDLLMDFTAVENGVRHTGQMYHSVNPDGKIRTLIFGTGRFAKWKGTITDIKFTYTSEDAARLHFAAINGVPRENLIPARPAPVPGKACFIGGLLPRGEYAYCWEGDKNPGAELKWFDHRFKEIGGVSMPASGGETVFLAPEQAAFAELTVNPGGTGSPRICRRKWQERHQLPLDWKSSWIWCQRESGPENTTVWFRKEFTLDAPPEAGVVALSVDDKFTLHVNGHRVGSGWPYFITFRYDITRYLREGRNTITIEAFNGETLGGALMEGFIRTAKSEMPMNTDGSWKFHVGGDAMPEQFEGQAVVLGPALLANPWGKRINPRYIGPTAELEVVEVRGSSFTAKVNRPLPAARDRIRIKAVSASGRVRHMNPRFRVVSGSWEKGGLITLEYAPPAAELEEYTIYADDDYFRIGNDVPIGRIPAFRGEVPPLSSVKITSWDDHQLISVNGGKPKYPLFWQFPERFAAENRQFTLADAKSAGAGIINLMLYAEESMKEDGSYDFSSVEERIAVVLNEFPEAELMFNAYLYMPKWWLGKHPDCRERNRQGVPVRASYDTALASMTWRLEAVKFLRGFVEYAKTQPWGHRVVGMTFLESPNGEWFWETQAYSNFGMSGFSPEDLATFRRMLKAKYRTDAALRAAWKDAAVTLGTAQFPTHQRIISGTVGALLDPETDRQLIDWFEYRNDSFAEQIIAFCRAVKESSGGKWLTGAYYGYYMHFSASGGRPIHDHGHNAILETAKSEYVDFVRAPSRYSLRKQGASDGIMQIPDSYKLRGKLVYIEQDFRSYTAIESDGKYGRQNYPVDSIGTLNRAFAMMLASGCSQYILDFGRWLYEPIMLNILAVQEKVFRDLPPVSGTTPYQAAIVGGEYSVYYTQRNGPFTIVNGATDRFTRKLNLLPLPFRQLLVEDLVEPGLVPPLKFYVMLAPVMLTDQQRTALLRRFEAEKATVIWLYAAGVTRPGKKPDAAANCDFLGISTAMEMGMKRPEMFLENGESHANPNVCQPFFYPVSGFDEVIGRDAGGRPMLVKKTLRGAVHYYATQLDLPVTLIADIARKAGVGLYAAPGADRWWIGNDIAAVYVVDGGEKSITLPAGTHLEQIIGPQLPKQVLGSGEKFPAAAGQTYIFLVKRDGK